MSWENALVTRVWGTYDVVAHNHQFSNILMFVIIQKFIIIILKLFLGLK